MLPLRPIIKKFARMHKKKVLPTYTARTMKVTRKNSDPSNTRHENPPPKSIKTEVTPIGQTRGEAVPVTFPLEPRSVEVLADDVQVQRVEGRN